MFQSTTTDPPVPEPLTEIGSEGTLAGVTALDALEEDVELPALFVAVDVNLYAVPFVKEDIMQLVPGEVTVHVAPPGEAVTV